MQDTVTVIYGRPLIASVFLMFWQIGFAVIYPACWRGFDELLALMESEDRRPSTGTSSKLGQYYRVWPIPVTLFCHHIIFTLAINLASFLRYGYAAFTTSGL